MNKATVVLAVTVLGIVGSAYGSISAIQAFGVATDYIVPELTLAANPIPQVTITFTNPNENPVTFYNRGTFSMNTFLISDWSGGGFAKGDFTGGVVAASWTDDSSELYLVEGDIDFFRLVEVSPNVLNGSGQFTVTDVIFPVGYEWIADVGSIASFTLGDLNYAIDDFQSDFSGTSMVTLTPDDTGIPEPATLVLLVSGSVLFLSKPILRRKGFGSYS